MAEAEPTILQIEGRQAFADAAVAVVRSARRSLWIASQSLPRQVYAQTEFLDALREFIVDNRRREVRVLVRHPRSAIRDSERFIELARRLSDQVALHQPLSEVAAPFERECLIADQKTFLLRNMPDDLFARHATNAPLPARQLRQEYEQLWQLSEASSELRALGI